MRVLITGGTSGIGRAVALLLRRTSIDADVIGGRNQAKGAELAAAFEDLRGALRFFPADLSSLEGINGALDEYLSQTENLDAAFLNAGIFKQKAKLDDKGRDTAFIVNYLHRFIFARRLNTVLRVSPTPRILINGSCNMAAWDRCKPASLRPAIRRNKEINTCPCRKWVSHLLAEPKIQHRCAGPIDQPGLCENKDGGGWRILHAASVTFVRHRTRESRGEDCARALGSGNFRNRRRVF